MLANKSVAIRIENLTKYYGKTLGISDVTFDVNAGEVMGFLGPNGAGKTTAIRTLLGLIKASSGSATILGQNALETNVELRRIIGYLPGISANYDRYTGRRYLNFIAHMRGLNLENEISTYAERLQVNLDSHIHDLSKGNRQKVGVIQAFMHSPDVLFLDEPTSGLDPLVQREFEKILEETRQRGAAVILSSHVLSEIEHLANRVSIIDRGRLILVDSVSALKAKAPRRIQLYFDEHIAISDFAKVPNIRDIEVHENFMRCVVTGSETELLRRAVELRVNQIRTEESTLEEIFLGLVGN